MRYCTMYINRMTCPFNDKTKKLKKLLYYYCFLFLRELGVFFAA